MSTPTDLTQPSQSSAPPDSESEQGLLIPGNLPDVTPRYRIESGPRHSTWIVDCGYQSAAQLDLQAGPYTLTQSTDFTGERVKAAERLCSLAPHPTLLRIDAVTSSSGSNHIWYEPAEAGTLADYCRAKGKLPLGQVATLARAIIQALSYLHEQGLTYRSLRAQDCVFTVRGQIKLLAPDSDTRRLTPALQESRKANDIAACATIIWRCLTGEDPKPMRLRAPLNLAVPQASDALAQTLEDAIDSRAQQPQLADLLALLELATDPEPLELHLSAHQSVRSRLPSYRSPTSAKPRRSLKQRREVYGKLPDLSQGNKARRTQGFLLKGRGRARKQLSLGGRLGGCWSLSGAVLIGVLALAGAGYQLFFTEHRQEGAAKAIVEASASPPASELLESDQQFIKTPGQLGEGPEQAADRSLSDDELALRAAELIASRSRVLAAGEIERIGDYAVLGSPLAEADRQLLASEGISALAGTSTELIAVTHIMAGEQEYRLQVRVQATGYSPADSDQELALQGIKVHEGKVTQEVELVLQNREGTYLLVEARPLPLETSAL